MEARTSDELALTAEWEKPLNGEPWTWQRDAISPQSRQVEKAVERLRKPEDGT